MFTLLAQLGLSSSELSHVHTAGSAQAQLGLCSDFSEPNTSRAQCEKALCIAADVTVWLFYFVVFSRFPRGGHSDGKSTGRLAVFLGG